MFYIIVRRTVRHPLLHRAVSPFLKQFTIRQMQSDRVQFRLITVRDNRIRWNSLLALLGGTADRVLLQAGVEIPGKPLPDRSIGFENKLILCALRTVLRRRGLYLQGKVTLVDYYYEYSEYVELLLAHFSFVTVVTKREKLYQGKAREVFDESGAVLMLADDLYHCNDSLVIICPKEVTLRKRERVTAAWVCTRPPKGVQTAHCFSHFTSATVTGSTLPLPVGVDRREFCEALYQYENFCDYENFGAISCTYQGLVCEFAAAFTDYLRDRGVIG